MKIVLNEAEVARACAKYVAGKNTSDANHDYVATIQWRGRTATVDVAPKVPTLTEVVK